MRVEPIEFTVADTELAGFVYLPEGAGPHPCVVLCTGYGGTQDTPSLEAAAAAFATAGYVALTFDYRNFGRSGGEPRQLVDIAGQPLDIEAAIAAARARPDVDESRIALWGTSLGGGHVVTVAAADPAIAAVVAQVPYNGFPKRVEGRSRWATLKVLAAILRDRWRGMLGRPPYYIPAVGATNEVAVMTGPQAQAAVAELDSATWRNEVAPRSLLAMARYKPGEHAPNLRMPILVCVGEFDKETAASDSRQLADLAPHGRVINYSFSHFDIYRPENRTKVLADQIEFLDAILRPENRPAQL
ncbi:alpha/beta fold hydrolase [Nocardia puris]|uniref:Serine aminopeptidase S33 domain-containing protein n=1 Tax=Nocardia puris TaxID=208602 RepID=A0A366DQU8_9NOCA|nr:alpha/beta fold hydrolase [Nocardia puris]MBF6211025.1 alpha/beta fold hydrolase [Nocardia puris]MBF6364621.1 alpha/beta fold hydrolase [Nocardia puris]MBF6459550.1 alpha/beta fold hydrolase [Nocardia puris]RBO92467.1 hypothetical protein DFR74_103110 [Nocardia puris]